MYSPTLGRFISTDPIGYEAGDQNLYRYVGNDPTGTVDPSGLQPPAPRCTDARTTSPGDGINLSLNGFGPNSGPDPFRQMAGLPPHSAPPPAPTAAASPVRRPPIPFPTSPGIGPVVSNQKLTLIEFFSHRIVGFPPLTGAFTSRDDVYRMSGTRVSPPRRATFPANADGTNVAAGTHRFFRLSGRNDGTLFGTGGAETCIGVLILTCGRDGKYNTGAVFHFYDDNDAATTLQLYGFGRDSRAIVFGGNNQTESVNTLFDVMLTLNRDLGITPDYTLDADTVWVDQEGGWHLRPAPPR